MFELKLTFKSADDLYAAVAKLAGEAAPVAAPVQYNTSGATAGGAVALDVPCVVQGPSGEKKKPGRPKKEPVVVRDGLGFAVDTLPTVTSSATGAAEPEPAPAAEEEPKPEGDAHLQVDAFPTPAPNAIPTHDDVTQAAQAVNAKVGLAKLKTLLADFQAARVSEVKVEDRAGFIARAQELCA